MVAPRTAPDAVPSERVRGIGGRARPSRTGREAPEVDHEAPAGLERSARHFLIRRPILRPYGACLLRRMLDNDLEVRTLTGRSSNFFVGIGELAVVDVLVGAIEQVPLPVEVPIIKERLLDMTVW